MDLSLNNQLPLISSLNGSELLNSKNDSDSKDSLINVDDNIFQKLKDKFDLKDKLNLEEIKSKVQEFTNQLKENITSLEENKGLSLKKIGLSLLGLVLGGALAFATFNLALYPISFVIQLLVSSGLPFGVPQQILNLLQAIFGLSVVGAQYGSIAGGAISGAKTFANLSKDTKFNPNNPDKIDINELLNKQIQESITKFNNSDKLTDYIRNGFNVGVNVSQKISQSSGNVVGILTGAALGLALMSPLALLIASLIVGKVGLVGALGAGLVVSLPLGIKAFNALKDFSKNVFSLIGGAIGGAVGAAIGATKKVIDSVKGLFSKDKKTKEQDEFTSNSPYKNQGVEKLADSFGKTTFSFVNGVSDFAALSSVITELLSKEPNGLQFIGKLVGGTIKAYQGTSILKQAAVDNKPELKNVGLFKFLTGFSLLASFLGPLFGPIGTLVFAILPLVFMGLEKAFEAKNKLNQNKNDKIQNNPENNTQNIDKKQEELKSSYAMGVAAETFVDSLGSLGKFWMGWDSIFGGGYGGLTSIFGIVGATKDVVDGAKMMTLSDDRSSLSLALMGLLNIVGGASLFLAAIGLGRVFGLISIGISIFKLVYQIMSMVNSKNESNKVSIELNLNNSVANVA
jgi:tetrahydromethanopterin S-methyltransferase subunit G